MIVYTSIVGEYPIARKDIQCLNGQRIFEMPLMDSKLRKVLVHLYLPDEPVTIWVDGNIWPLIDAQALVDRYLGDADIALFAHPRRSTVWQEFETLRNDRGRFAIPYLQKQIAEQEDAYRKSGFPGGPLCECNFMIRRNTAGVAALMNAWWSEICRWQWRDQVSFPYVLWKHGGGVLANIIKAHDIRRNPIFRYVQHY